MKTLIAACLLLALASPVHAAPEKQWSLIFDTWFCDVHDCGEGKPAEKSFVHKDTYATRKQCLAEGRRLVADKTITPHVFAEETSTPIGRISPRCVGPASAAELTATPAQWRDIYTLQIAFFRCDISETYDPEIKKACVLSRKLQDKLAKQGFCTYKHILVGRLAWHGPEEDRVQLWPKGEKQCYALHEPTP